MSDPCTEHVIVEDLTREHAAADVAAFLHGADHVDGLIVATATADERDIVVVLKDAFDGARRLRLLVVQG